MILFAVGMASGVNRVLAEQEAMRDAYNTYLKMAPEPHKTYEEFSADTSMTEVVR